MPLIKVLTERYQVLQVFSLVTVTLTVTPVMYRGKLAQTSCSFGALRKAGNKTTTVQHMHAAQCCRLSIQTRALGCFGTLFCVAAELPLFSLLCSEFTAAACCANTSSLLVCLPAAICRVLLASDNR
jgi:hypothetical protein